MLKSKIASRALRADRHRGPAGRALDSLVLAAAVIAVLQAFAASPAPAQTTIQPQPVQPQPIQPAPQGQPPATQSPATAGQRFGDWVQRCTPNPPPQASPPAAGQQTVCFIMQQVMDNNTQRPMLKITIGFFGPQRQPGAVIAMPLGVPLARGMHLSVDGTEIDRVPFQVCRRDGCTAFIPLDDKALGAFRAGAQAVASVDSGQGESLNLPISLNGFTAGYGSLQ